MLKSKHELSEPDSDCCPDVMSNYTVTNVRCARVQNVLLDCNKNRSKPTIRHSSNNWLTRIRDHGRRQQRQRRQSSHHKQFPRLRRDRLPDVLRTTVNCSLVSRCQFELRIKQRTGDD